MKINEKYLKFQEGGAMPAGNPNMGSAPAEGGAPAADQQEQVMQQLAGMAQEIIQQLGPEAAMALAQMIMEMLQGAAQPQPALQRQGGRIVRVR